MRRILRLLTLWLFALALPIQGAAAVAGMSAHAAAPSATMTMPDGTVMDAHAMPCHGHPHALDTSGCGACCGPIVVQQSVLAVAPVVFRWSALPHPTADAAEPQFLTGGTDRPPRGLLA